jgi:zinc protease
MAFGATFEPDELEREREVVFEEFRLGEDNPRTSLVRRLYDLAFQGHPYGSPVLGDMDVLRTATRDSLRRYYKRHYTPENMTVVAVGAVNPHEVRDAVRAAFGAVPAAGYRRAEPEVAAPVQDGRDDVVERPERQAFLGLAWPAPPLGHADMFAVDLLTHVLGGSRSSRLHQALREQARLVSGVGASYGALQRGGLVSVTAQVEPADVERAEAAVIDEVRRIQDAGVTDEELARALTAAEAHHLFARETAEGLALAYGRADTLWSLAGERAYLARLRAVTRDDVARAARRYLTDAYARLAFVPRGRSR